MAAPLKLVSLRPVSAIFQKFLMLLSLPKFLLTLLQLESVACHLQPGPQELASLVLLMALPPSTEDKDDGGG